MKLIDKILNNTINFTTGIWDDLGGREKEKNERTLLNDDIQMRLTGFRLVDWLFFSQVLQVRLFILIPII